MDPIVSVIIPTYNRVDDLVIAIESVQMQTFKDLEIIVVDDGSTDNTKQVVASHTICDGRIRYIDMGRNSGCPVHPRNTGCANAKGKYLAFLDSDDLWEPEKLKLQVWYLEVTGEVFSYHNMLVKYVDVGRSELWSKMSTCFSGEVFEVLLRKNFVPTSSVLIRSSVYNEFGPMDWKFKISHDWDLWLKVASKYQFHYIPDNLGGTLSIHYGSVIGDVHKRREESRKIVRKWKSEVSRRWYYKIMLYYYLMEVFDVLPKFLQGWVRSWWYEQERYK
ncbi:MAG: glycosyltransferase family 2 protein [Planctomycetes bacterium]|nr:glycosyltransferase family 2 protein [Planctomycetota bacterium]